MMRSNGTLGPEEGRVLANGMSNGVDVRHLDPSRIDAADLAALSTHAAGLVGSPEAVVVGMIGRLARDKGIKEIECLVLDARILD